MDARAKEIADRLNALVEAGTPTRDFVLTFFLNTLDERQQVSPAENEGHPRK